MQKSHLKLVSILFILTAIFSSCGLTKVDLSPADFFPKESKLYADLQSNGESESLEEIKSFLKSKQEEEGLDDENKAIMNFLEQNINNLHLSIAIEEGDKKTDEVLSLIDGFNIYIRLESENINELFKILEPKLKQDEKIKNLYINAEANKYLIKNETYILITNTQENAQKLMDIGEGKIESLASNEEFAKSIKKIKKSENAILSYFVDFDIYQKILASEDLGKNGKIFNLLKNEALTIEKTNENEFNVRAYVSTNETESNDQGIKMNDSAAKLKLHKFIPKDALTLYAETFNVKKQFDLIKQSFEKDQIDEGTFALTAGIMNTLEMNEDEIAKLQNLLLSLDQNAAFALNTSDSKLTPELTLIAELNKDFDSNEAKTIIKNLGEKTEKYITKATEAGQIPIAIKYELKEGENETYFTLSPDLSIATLFLGLEKAPEINITFGIFDNKIVLSTFKDIQNIFANKDLSLASDKDFKSYIGLIAKKSPIMYMKFEPLSKYIAKIGETLQNENAKEISSLIGNLNTIFVSSKAKDYEAISEGIILFNDKGSSKLIKGLMEITPKLIQQYFTKPDYEMSSEDEYTYVPNKCDFDQTHWAYRYMNDVTGRIVPVCNEENKLINGKDFISYLIQTFYYSDISNFIPSNDTVYEMNSYDVNNEYLLIAKNKGLIDDNFKTNDDIKYEDAINIISKTGFAKIDEIEFESKATKNDILTFADAAEIIFKSEMNYYTHYDEFQTEENTETVDYSNWVSYKCAFSDKDWESNYTKYLFDMNTLDRCFNESNNIKTAEFLELIIKTAYGDASYEYVPSSDSPYKTVTKDHWAFEYIKLAYDNSLLDSLEAETFDPDSEIKIGDAINIITATGYLTKDDISTNIFEGKTPRSDKKLTFKNAIKMIYELDNKYFDAAYAENSTDSFAEFVGSDDADASVEEEKTVAEILSQISIALEFYHSDNDTYIKSKKEECSSDENSIFYQEMLAYIDSNMTNIASNDPDNCDGFWYSANEDASKYTLCTYDEIGNIGEKYYLDKKAATQAKSETGHYYCEKR